MLVGQVLSDCSLIMAAMTIFQNCQLIGILIHSMMMIKNDHGDKENDNVNDVDDDDDDDDDNDARSENREQRERLVT